MSSTAGAACLSSTAGAAACLSTYAEILASKSLATSADADLGLSANAFPLCIGTLVVGTGIVPLTSAGSLGTASTVPEPSGPTIVLTNGSNPVFPPPDSTVLVLPTSGIPSPRSAAVLVAIIPFNSDNKSACV